MMERGGVFPEPLGLLDRPHRFIVHPGCSIYVSSIMDVCRFRK